MTEEILPTTEQSEEWFSCSLFDHIIIRSPRLNVDPAKLAIAAKPLLVKNGKLLLLSSPPRLGERISRILADECEESDLAFKLKQAEEVFFENWDTGELTAAFEEQGFTVEQTIIDQKEERLITEKDLSSWFNTEQSRWGSFMFKNLNNSDFSAIEDCLRIRIAKGPLLWRWRSVLYNAKITSD